MKKVLESNYSNMEVKYANQTLIQGTDVDMAIGFGIVGLNKEGKDVADIHTIMRMSHAQFESLTEHCNEVLAKINAEKK